MKINKTVLNVSELELTEIFNSVITKSSTNCAISYEAYDNNSKTKKGKNVILKDVEMIINFNHNYEKKVMKSADLDVFESGKNWHTRLHKDNNILRVKNNDKTKKYIAYTLDIDSNVKSIKTYNNKVITTKQAIELDLFTNSGLKAINKPINVAKNGIEIDFFFRVLAIENIKTLNYGKITYINNSFVSKK